MDVVKEFTEKLILGLVKDTDIVKVKDFEDEEGNLILEVIVSQADMPVVIGRSGATAKSIRTLVNAVAYKQKLNRVKVNIDSI
ncbi:MAG TPA: RNA-binding protein [Firmicutes bacterium]|nr:RNA-binding protein [Bacillota bacterium]